MRVYHRRPGPPPDRFVEVFWLCEGGPQTHSKERVIGPQTEYCVIDTEEQTSVAGIHFKPGGAYPFLRRP